MHLVFADPYAIPAPTPSAIQSLQNVDALAAVGARVTLVTPVPAGDFRAESVLGRPLHAGVEVIHLPDLRRRWFFPFRSNRLFFRRAAEVVANLGADALYVRNLKLASYLLARCDMPPLFFETHEIFAQSFVESHDLARWSQRRKLRTLEALEARVYREVQGLISITATLRDDIHQRFGAVAPGYVAPDGVDMALATASFRSAGIKKGAPVFLYLGSLHSWKGVPILIKAMREVSRGRLCIAGGPSARVAELADLCRALGVEDRVELLGSVPPLSRFELISAADICLLPSSASSIGARYTSPLKLFEYLAMGKAVIAADLPALREVLRNGENARLVPVDDPSAMAAAMNELAGNPVLAKTLGDAAALSAPQYSWHSRARELLEWITKQLERKS
jgi:glycosyltransferase involved in cell wall biosynthesis